MRYRLTIPARINILGNPTDANEGDFATITAAVEIRAGGIAEKYEGLLLEVGPRTAFEPENQKRDSVQCLEWKQAQLPLPYTGQLDLLKAAINRLAQFSSEFRQKFRPDLGQGVRLAVWSEVPRQSGLGGSSLFVLIALAALREVYQLDRRKHHDYFLAELAQRVEGKELGIACGFADRYAPLFGGLAYLDYRGKLYQKEICEEPLVTYERLDAWVEDLPLLVITTGIQHESGDVHGRMRPRYLQEHAEWVHRGGSPPNLVRLMSDTYETAWRGKIALLQGDLAAFGSLMNRNHQLVNEMMEACGFQDGAGWANNLFIQAALENGALGAKLTGAGDGGSVFALTEPGKEEDLRQIWEYTAKQYGLTSAHIFHPQIARQGLLVEEIRDPQQK